MPAALAVAKDAYRAIAKAWPKSVSNKKIRRTPREYLSALFVKRFIEFSCSFFVRISWIPIGNKKP